MVLFMEGAVDYDCSCNYAILCKWSILPLTLVNINLDYIKFFTSLLWRQRMNNEENVREKVIWESTYGMWMFSQIKQARPNLWSKHD